MVSSKEIRWPMTKEERMNQKNGTLIKGYIKKRYANNGKAKEKEEAIIHIWHVRMLSVDQVMPLTGMMMAMVTVTPVLGLIQ